MKRLMNIVKNVALLGLAGLLLVSTGNADKRGSGDDLDAGAAPGEGVGSLPSVLAPSAGLLLVGEPEELIGVVERLSFPSGTGSVFAFEMNPGVIGGEIAVSIVGDATVRMNRSALAASTVEVYLSTGFALEGAQAQVAVGGVTIAQMTLGGQSFVELPLGAWFSPSPLDPPALSLQAINTTGPAALEGPLWFGAQARTHGDALVVRQRASF